MCSEDHSTLAELVECADNELFDKVLINSGHVLYTILPRETVSTYALRRRRHNRKLTSKTKHLEQCSFIVRMLYKGNNNNNNNKLPLLQSRHTLNQHLSRRTAILSLKLPRRAATRSQTRPVCNKGSHSF